MKHIKENDLEIDIKSNKKIVRIIYAIVGLGMFYLWSKCRLTIAVASFQTVYNCCFMLMGIMAILISRQFIIKEFDMSKFFIICIVPLGIIYTLLIPPGIVPDEWAHMQNTFSLSSQVMGKEVEGKIMLRSSEATLLSQQVSSPYSVYYDYIYNNIISINQDNTYQQQTAPSFSFKQLFAYFPSVVGLTIGRILHLGAVTTVYLGRITNFVFYTVLTYLAMKKLPFGKVLLFAISMLPMATHQMCSLSYDAVVNATAFFAISYGMFFIYQSDEVKLKDLILYGLNAVLLITNKGSAYAFILVIPILAKYFNPNGEKIAKKTKIIIFLLVITVILLLNYRSFTSSEQVSAVQSVSQGLVPWTGTPSHSLSSMISDIPGTISLFLNTFVQKGMWYVNTAIGSELGWLNILMPMWIINTWLGILFISAFCEKSNNEVFTHEHKFLFFLIALAVIMVVMLAMALAWTPMEYTYIEGVQGRYYIPIIYLLFIIFQNSHIYLKKNLVKILLVVIPLMTIVSVVNLIPLVLI